MSLSKWLLVTGIFPLLALSAGSDPARAPDKAVLVIHGGAGVAPRAKMTAEKEKEYRADLERALRAGHEVLQKNGTSLDAVEAAIRVLEDSPLFNAGKGAVFTREGRNELDASIMDGKTKKAGAVAGVTRVKNPIAAARAVMEKSEHVLMIGDGADRFAISQGVTEVNPLYFWTPHRWQQMLDARDKEPARHDGGTVGAVAVDHAGNLAAGTSTGGMNCKRPGRVGDSPIIGAGTYADNKTCAVSCTGHGEVFIQYAVAHDIVARMRYKNLGLPEAVAETFADLPKEEGGVGGLIALDRDGNFVMPFNTNGMHRGYVTAEGKTVVAIYEK